jgi:hypothetical protein
VSVTTALVILAAIAAVVVTAALAVLASTHRPPPPYQPPDPPGPPPAVQGPSQARWEQEEDLTDPNGWHGYRRQTLEVSDPQAVRLMVKLCAADNQLPRPPRS